MEENKNQQMPKEINSWKEVTVDVNYPINVLVNLINVMNQRIALLEDQVQIEHDGKTTSVTEFYQEQEKLFQEQMKKEAEAKAAATETDSKEDANA